MRKALVALVGTVVVGVLPFAAPASAKEFAFQGGEPFGAPAVGMTMTGKSFKHPRRVTGFSIALPADCPGYAGPDPLTLPIRRGTKGGKGIVIKSSEKKGTRFDWSYTDPGGVYYRLQGVQRKDPSTWIGVEMHTFPKAPAEDCATSYENRWKAEFTGLI